MTLRNTFPSGLPTGLPILDTRLALSGLIARDAAGQPRLGLLPDTLDPVVTGTSSMAYQVGPFRAVTSRGGLGVELVANDGAVKVDTTAAPSTNARLDVIYVQPRFSLDGDSTDSPVIGVVQGATAPVASLVRPAAPAGALVLAVAQVSFGATSTAGSGVVITQLAPYTAASGGTVVVRNEAELAAWTPADGSKAWVAGSGASFTRSGKVWARDSAHAEFTALTVGLSNGALYLNVGTQIIDASRSNDLTIAQGNAGNIRILKSGIYSLGTYLISNRVFTGRSVMYMKAGGVDVAFHSSPVGELTLNMNSSPLLLAAGTDITFGVLQTSGGNANTNARTWVTRLSD